jgi:hypothetical protein
MMKQPAENTNATREEIEAARARATPISHDPTVITEEVARIAYQCWRDRGSVGGSPEEDWFRAEQIVRDRLHAALTAGSYLSRTSTGHRQVETVATTFDVRAHTAESFDLSLSRFLRAARNRLCMLAADPRSESRALGI